MKDAKDLGTYSKTELNRWQKERIMQTVITKDTFNNIPNDRYFQVSPAFET